MRILFEARSIIPNKSGGIENYLYMLVNAWKTFYPMDEILLNVPLGTVSDYEARLKNVELFVDTKFERFISFYRRNIVFRKSISVFLKVFPNLEKSLFGLRRSWIKEIDSKVDVIIYPYQREKFVHNPYKTIFVMHDFREWDQHIGDNRIIKEQIKAIKNAAAIVVSWPYPFKRLLQLFPETYERAYEIPFLYDEYNESDTQEDFSIPPFLYYPSANAKHKNHENLIRGLKQFNDTYPKNKLNLICTGPINNKRKGKIDELISELKMKNEVVFLGFVDRDKVFELYKQCYAVVTSSKYEAFSGAVLEAFRFKKPVLASSIQPNVAFLEKYNLSLTLFDPDNPDMIAESIEKLVNDYDKHMSLSSMGFERLKHITPKYTIDRFREIALKIQSKNAF